MELDVKRDNCLIVEFTTGPSSSSSPSPTDNISIVFPGYSELYTWRDELYLRSALSSAIGLPTNFVHLVHVGYDPMTGAFTVSFFFLGCCNATTWSFIYFNLLSRACQQIGKGFYSLLQRRPTTRKPAASQGANLRPWYTQPPHNPLQDGCGRWIKAASFVL